MVGLMGRSGRGITHLPLVVFVGARACTSLCGDHPRIEEWIRGFRAGVSPSFSKSLSRRGVSSGVAQYACMTEEIIGS